MYYIFNDKGDNIGSSDFELDSDDLSARKQFAIEYNEPFSGSLKADPESKTIRIIPPAPSEFHTWDNEKSEWTISQEAIQAALNAKKESKLTELNQRAQAFINKASEMDKLPEFEVQTWTLQAMEAKAYQADKSAATPILDTIAQNRNIDRETLIQAALRKTLAYEALSAAIAGQRQALQTKIEKAASEDELNAIEIVFKAE